MNIAFFPEGDEAVSASRIRCFDVAAALKRRGHDVTVYPGLYGPNLTRRDPLRWRRRVAKRQQDLHAARDADVWFVHRGTEQWGVAAATVRAARRHRRRFVFDFDDAVHLKAPRATRRIVAAADAVTAGNDWLTQAASQWSDHAQWLPTGLDTTAYAPATAPAAPGDGRLVVGWIGGLSNLHYLAACAPALRALQQEHHFVLRLITDTRLPLHVPYLHGIDWEARPWALATAPGEVARFDVGLMPLGSRPWDAGKCGFKALEYAAAGAGIVATRTGYGGAIIGDQERGWGVEPDGDWHEPLAAALGDPGERRRRGEAAQAWVQQVHDIDVVAGRVEALLHGVATS